MDQVEFRSLPAAADASALWQEVARQALRWLQGCGADVREACVLLPFAELLPLARRAFAAAGGWLPRLHTPRTLAAECPPGTEQSVDALAPTGVVALDRLLAARMLRQQPWADRWARTDRRAFEHAISALVHSVHALLRAAAAVAPTQREAFWQRARETLPGAGDAWLIDSALQRIAVAWASTAPAPDTDRLFVRRPSAWIAVELGGDDALVAAVIAQAAGVPCLRLGNGCANEDDPLANLGGAGRIERVCADDAEQEAWAAAHEVLLALEAGRAPVALIAEDRALVRRIRAVLERSGVAVDDETGWSLATTRAGAEVASALRAADPMARDDERLDWLKSRSAGVAAADVSAVEAYWRRRNGLDAASSAQAEACWSRERDRLAALAVPSRQSLARRLAALDRLLHPAAAPVEWLSDPAAQQVRAALGFDASARWRLTTRVLEQVSLSLQEFTEWVEATLEEARYLPPREGADGQVVLTPLARALGRPFACVVIPGADERRLPLDRANPLLLFGEPVLPTLGLPDHGQRQRRQALALRELLRTPHAVFVRRHSDGDEPLAPSPWVDRLMLARGEAGPAIEPERTASLPRRVVRPAGVEPPSPRAAGLLPMSWSASAVEDLRQCPYRFFARSVLGLRSVEELDDEADKRDYGRWLHATLERFHREGAEAVPEAEAERFARIGRELLQRMSDRGDAAAAALLPYTAGLGAFARRYVEWHRGQLAQGWRFDSSEVEGRYEGDADDPLRLHGRIDRVDRRAAAELRLIDYKTSARDLLSRRVAQPLEDTQLAVYAALMLRRLPPGGELSAMYVALDDADGPTEVVHRDVLRSARRLVAALGDERRRLDAGAAMPALGRGPVCDTCDARGLCRRDHWTRAATP